MSPLPQNRDKRSHCRDEDQIKYRLFRIPHRIMLCDEASETGGLDKDVDVRGSGQVRDRTIGLKPVFPCCVR